MKTLTKGCCTLARLFDRELEVLIGDRATGLRVTGDFKVVCEIVKDIRASEPDQATVHITNLNDSSRSKIQGGFTLVQINAGYDGVLKTIFEGEIVLARSVKQRTEWVTEIVCGDGAKAIAQSYLSKTYNSGVALRTILKDAALAMGTTLELVQGNYLSASLPRGKAIDNSTRNVLDQLGATHDFEWSVQNGKLVVIPLGKAKAQPPVVISAETGMVGSPEFMDDGQNDETTNEKKKKKGSKEQLIDKKRGLRFKTLLLPELVPGGQVVVESPTLKGQVGTHIFEKAGGKKVAGLYNLKRVAHSLETQGGEFATGCESEAAA